MRSRIHQEKQTEAAVEPFGPVRYHLSGTLFSDPKQIIHILLISEGFCDSLTKRLQKRLAKFRLPFKCKCVHAIATVTYTENFTG